MLKEYRILMIVILATILNCDFISDIEPPDVAVTAPENNSYISDKVVIVLDVNDNKNVKKVELYADDSLLTTFEGEPFVYQWKRFMDCTTHTIKAKAYDNVGNWREGDSIIIRSLPVLISSSNISYDAFEIFLNNDYLFLATKNGLVIFDVSNPSSPQEIVSCDTGFYVDDVFIQGSYAYIVCVNMSNYNHFLKIIDISNITNPAIVGVRNLDLSYSSLFVYGQYAYIINDDSYSNCYPLQIVDISNPSNPILIGWINDYNTEYLCDICINGNYTYVIDAYGYLGVVDISNPSAPNVITWTDLDDYGGSIFIKGNYLFTNGGEIVDITNPESPQLISHCWGGQDVYVVDEYAYFASGLYDGLTIVDVTSKENPITVGEINDESWFWQQPEIAVSKPYAYVVYYDGIDIIQISP